MVNAFPEIAPPALNTFGRTQLEEPNETKRLLLILLRSVSIAITLLSEEIGLGGLGYAIIALKGLSRMSVQLKFTLTHRIIY